MPEVKKILYATDLSTNSAYAFQFASEYADKCDAELVILHVLDELPESIKLEIKRLLPDVDLNKRKEITEDIKNRLEEFCDNVRKDDPSCSFRVFEIVVSQGPPAIEILKKADEFDCDVIVMGTHGKGIIEHAFLGSIAEKVLRNSHKPVFVIPLPKGKSALSLRDI